METNPYKKMYTSLFNAITDALEYMEKGMYPTAIKLLKAAQCDTEELYLDWDGIDEDDEDNEEDM